MTSKRIGTIANIDGASIVREMASVLEKLRNYNLDRWLPGYAQHLARRAVTRPKTIVASQIARF